MPWLWLVHICMVFEILLGICFPFMVGDYGILGLCWTWVAVMALCEIEIAFPE